MASVKRNLKLARDSLDKKDYETAKSASLAALESDTSNYNAHVFYGLALLELGEKSQSEQSYRKAIELNPDVPLAWQGIAKLYKQTDQLGKYAEVLEQLMKLYAASDDATKCAESLQKYIELRRQEPIKVLLLVDALSLLLPQSRLYPVLSGLAPPDPTNPIATSTFAAQSAVQNSLPVLEEIVRLLEKDEDERFPQEVEKRRTRLNAPSPDVLRQEVGREIWATSRLPEYYNEILNHPNASDELRRETESKLFEHRRRYLSVLPPNEESSSIKTKLVDEVDDLVNGIILLRIPNESAWRFYVEGQDCRSINEYDFVHLRTYIELFPSSALSQILRGYYIYANIPITDGDDDGSSEPGVSKVDDDSNDSVDMVLDASNSLQDSIVSHHILTEIYSSNFDNIENVIKVAEGGLELVRRAEVNRGRKFNRTRKAFEVTLGTSLVQYYPPKHHPRALRLLDDVLSEEPDNVPCLMGRAFVLQRSRHWTEAEVLFLKVRNLLPEDFNEGLRAQEEHAWCVAQREDPVIASTELQEVLQVLDELDDRDDDKARCWWRLGKCLWDMGGESRDKAYQHFITSLKRSPSFAPAFTSLGIYYAEFASPPDPSRASKCFQKAFELDAREVDSAKRLAEGFAEEREWDLVEVIAKRAIEGEGGIPDGTVVDQRAAASSKFLPVNAWAWKAVGVVELNRRNYAAAIHSFQVALRGEPDDQILWIRLGEAYSKAGRHAAAVKALGRARELQPDDWMCLYLTGEVQCQTRKFKEAIASFESVLVDRPLELGVLLSLAYAYFCLGCEEADTGFSSRAESSFLTSIKTALRAVDSSPGFRRLAWKVIADSLYHLSDTSSSSADVVQVQAVLSKVQQLCSTASSERLTDLSILPLEPPQSMTGIKILDLSVVAYDYMISLGFYDDKAKASSWFDLGTALEALCKRNGVIDRQKAHDQAIRCFKEAILGDPGNELHWVALGNAYFETNPKNAQHAYVKALEINSKAVEIWANLGLLYLQYEDLELANQAFYRTQTLDPDYPLAWIGQGLVASLKGHDVDAENLFQHAVGLGSTLPEADFEYATRLFSRLANVPQHRSTSSRSLLLPAFFVLDRYCKKKPDDPSSLHLFGLVCELVGHYELAVQLIERTIAVLEAAYEESEDTVIERQFTISNTNLGRLRLAIGDHEGALESFESALGLLGDDEARVSGILRAQCHFGSGLAHFKLGALEFAMKSFEKALQYAGDNSVVNGHVTVLLAQTLWAINTDEARESAKSHLLQCITSDPENLEAINALAGMGILTADEGLVDAALSEILSLPLHQRHETDPRRDALGLVVKNHLCQGDLSAALSEAQKAVFADPASSDLRNNVALLAMQEQHYDPALAMLSRAPTSLQDASDVSKLLGLRAVAECLSGRNSSSSDGGDNVGVVALGLAQKAIVLRPADIDNWRVLAFVRSYHVEKKSTSKIDV